MIVDNKYFSGYVLYSCQNRMQAKLQEVLYVIIDQDNGKDGLGQPFSRLVLNVLNHFAIHIICHSAQAFVDGSGVKACRNYGRSKFLSVDSGKVNFH